MARHLPDGVTALDMAEKGEVRAYTGTDPLAPGDVIRVRDLDETARLSGPNLYVVKRTLSPSPDSVSRSNVRSLLRDFGHVDGVHELRGGADGSGLAIRADVAHEGLLEAVDGLDAYALYDEEDHSELESEERQKAVENWAAYDLYKAVSQSEFVENVSELYIISLHDLGMFVDQFDALASTAGVEWNETSDGEPTISVQKIVVNISYLDLLDASIEGHWGWLTSGLHQVLHLLAELFGIVPWTLTKERAAILIDWLWLEEGVQPSEVIGPFDEASLRHRMDTHLVSVEEATRIGRLVASMSPDGLAMYEKLANLFVRLQALVEAVESARSGDVTEQANAFEELAPVAISTMSELQALESEGT